MKYYTENESNIAAVGGARGGQVEAGVAQRGEAAETQRLRLTDLEKAKQADMSAHVPD